jgi:hypothetical protein
MPHVAYVLDALALVLGLALVNALDPLGGLDSVLARPKYRIRPSGLVRISNAPFRTLKTGALGLCPLDPRTLELNLNEKLFMLFLGFSALDRKLCT